jgi:putative DNA primase/helicase
VKGRPMSEQIRDCVGEALARTGRGGGNANRRGAEQQEKREQQDRPQPPPLSVLPPPSDPMRVGREFVVQHCLRDGVPILRYWRDGWWAWRTSHWFEIDRGKVRSMLYRFTEHSTYFNAEGEAKPWAPTRHKIGDLLEALGAIVIMSNEVDQPSWVDKRTSGTIVAVANGLLDIDQR